MNYSTKVFNIGNNSEAYMECWQDERVDSTDIGNGLMIPYHIEVRLLNGDKHQFMAYNKDSVREIVTDRLNNVGTDSIEIKKGAWLTARYVTRWSPKDSILREMLREEFVKNKEDRARQRVGRAVDRTAQASDAANERILEATAITIDMRQRAMWNNRKRATAIKTLTRDPHGSRSEGIQYKDYDNKTWLVRIDGTTGQIVTEVMKT